MFSQVPPKFGLDCDALLRLRLHEGLASQEYCAEACAELAVLLRCCYNKSSKALQTRLFDLTLLALSCLHKIDGRLVESAVRLVVQAAEAALPAQKKAAVRREFKQAGIERRRRQEQQQRRETAESSQGLPTLPPDVVHHLLWFLDLPSLQRAAAVCVSWRDSVRQHDQVWRIHLGRILPTLSSRPPAHLLRTQGGFEAFAAVAQGLRSGELLAHRLLCRDCGAVVWVPAQSAAQSEASLADYASTRSAAMSAVSHSRRNCCHNQWCLASSCQVVSCLAGLDSLDSSSDDSDDDTETSGFRLWATPKIWT